MDINDLIKASSEGNVIERNYSTYEGKERWEEINIENETVAELRIYLHEGILRIREKPVKFAIFCEGAELLQTLCSDFSHIIDRTKMYKVEVSNNYES